MMQTTPINQTSFRILYLKYKDYFVPFSIIGICFLLFIFFIIPQMQTWFTLSSSIADEQTKLITLQQNLTFASKLDSIALASKLTLASKALPQDKDFEAVLDAVSNAAVNAHVGLGDYNFVVGDLSKPSAQQSNLIIVVSVLGGIKETQQYIVSLKKQFPLSEITDIQVTPSSSSISIIFYFQSIGKIAFDDTTPLSPLSKKDQDLLTFLATIQ